MSRSCMDNIRAGDLLVMRYYDRDWHFPVIRVTEGFITIRPAYGGEYMMNNSDCLRILKIIKKK